MKAPPGFRIDAFADARMGRSIFQMQPEDWLVPDDRRFGVYSEATGEYLGADGETWTMSKLHAGRWTERYADKRAEVMCGGARHALSIVDLGR